MKTIKHRFSRRHGSMPIGAALAVIVFSLFSCGHMGAVVSGSEVRSIRMADNNGATIATLSNNDTDAMCGFISEAEYDTQLNDGSVAVKMAAPDYTLIVSYMAGTQDDWVQIWGESGRTMFRSNWYFLREADLPKARAILEKYRLK